LNEKGSHLNRNRWSVTNKNAKQLAEAADVLVAGSYVFGAEPIATVADFKKITTL
jgi:pentose-5-phosphate-3-epimerase